MENTYFVSYKLYNSESEGWAYKYELKTTDKDLAIRKFGELINQYYNVSPFTFGCILVEDMFGNTLKKETWQTATESAEA